MIPAKDRRIPPHMADNEPVFDLKWVADCCLRVAWEADGPGSRFDEVRAAVARLSASPMHALRDVTPAAASLLLTFDLAGLDPEQAEALVRGALQSGDGCATPPLDRRVTIPVCYHPELGPDLPTVARLCRLSPADAATRHAAGEHRVQFIGFAPGFPYILGLPASLAVARLDQPRLRVPAGSVGIANDYTGIYPHVTSGGWRLIGRTPLRLFDAHRSPPARLAMGDRVTFEPITLDQFRTTSEHEN